MITVQSFTTLHFCSVLKKEDTTVFAAGKVETVVETMRPFHNRYPSKGCFQRNRKAGSRSGFLLGTLS